ncbi:MAG: precorrin-6y C5,15-methyltransferase (decarboxylating) subunit CbiE [Actinobacteria bacterium]|nr:precorrin-6y C5,15-methyltransferase (decarboxylating) subunit CbiE [Actinomycetota bacterium]MCL5446228.1 precorrin-6y C5,15-methyltransferase (decarboxylating) subunit CbiE [Actinomycetota bacterium]
MNTTSLRHPATEAKVAVIGVAGDMISLVDEDARNAIENAGCLLGSSRLLEIAVSKLATREDATLLSYGHDLNITLGRIADIVASGTKVAILASGDPGFFGVLRALSRVIDRESIEVFPAVSSIAMAFSKVVIPWDDAVVVSMHGRPPELSVARILASSKVAVLTSPETPPHALARMLVQRNAHAAQVIVCSNLSTDNEIIVEADLGTLAGGNSDPYSVMILIGMNGLPLGGYMSSTGCGIVPTADPKTNGLPLGGYMSNGDLTYPPDGPAISFGMESMLYRHRGNLITKDEVRAIVLSKLKLPRYGVLWDVGSGSGAVAIEAARLSPGLTVFAIDQDGQAISNIQSNAISHAAQVHAVYGHAPEILLGLPAPDRVFVGGGRIPALKAAMKRIARPGRIVAAFAAIDRAAAAAKLLGSMVQVSVSESSMLPDGSVRLVPRNPVFVAYGDIDPSE